MRDNSVQALYGVPPEDYTNTQERENNTISKNTTTKKNTIEDEKYNSYVSTQDLYGPPPEDIKTTTNNAGRNNTLSIVNIGVVIVLFVLGLVAVINKKLSNKAKIIVAILIILAMIAVTVVIQCIRLK